MAKQFRVSFTVPAEKLSTIMEILTGEVDGFRVDDLDKVTPIKREKKIRPTKWLDRIKTPRNEWPMGQLILAKIKADGVCTARDLEDHLAQHGYARSSINSMITGLHKEGYVRRFQDDSTTKTRYKYVAK